MTFYVIPSSVIVCGGLRVVRADVRTGTAYFFKDTPDSLLVSIDRDGRYYVGMTIVPENDLASVISSAGCGKGLPLELNIDRSVSFGQVQKLLSAARDAGYAGAFVIGGSRSIIGLSSRG
jgi:biopolymer transport protein ExbD